MPLMRLIAENVESFERLEIDFSDGNSKPYVGPHILAGVNGSGKSTVLRAIAWAMRFLSQAAYDIKKAEQNKKVMARVARIARIKPSEEARA